MASSSARCGNEGRAQTLWLQILIPGGLVKGKLEQLVLPFSGTWDECGNAFGERHRQIKNIGDGWESRFFRE